MVEEEEEDEDEDTRTRTSAVGHGGEEKKSSRDSISAFGSSRGPAQKTWSRGGN